MDKRINEILKKLEKLSAKEPVLVPAIIISVDEDNLTAIIEINELEFTARLNAAEGSIKGYLIIPTINSWVIAGKLDENGDIYTILAYTEVDKIIMRGGENGGLINIQTLIAQLGKLSGRVDTIENAIKNSAVAAGDGGATFKTNMITAIEANPDKEDFSDMEDTSIIH